MKIAAFRPMQRLSEDNLPRQHLLAQLLYTRDHLQDRHTPQAEDLTRALRVVRRSKAETTVAIKDELVDRFQPTPTSTKLLFSSIGTAFLGLCLAIPFPTVGLSMLAVGGGEISRQIFTGMRTLHEIAALDRTLQARVVQHPNGTITLLPRGEDD